MKGAKGFTLIEMLITIAIFILLSGAVFGLVTVVLTTTSSLQVNENRQDEISALHAFLKRSLGNLPATGVFVSYRRGDGEGLVNNGVIVGDGDNLMAIDAKVQPNSYYLLRVARYTPVTSGGVEVDPLSTFQNEIQSGNALDWRPLIADVSKVSWKFQPPNVTKWDDQWFQPNQKPNLAEFSVLVGGELQPAVMDFWIPNLTAPPIFGTSPTTP